MATMFDTLSLFVIPLLCLLITTFLILCFIFKIRSPTSNNQTAKPHIHLPPSPPSLPLIGHLHHLFLPLHKCLQSLSSKYGPLIYLRLGPISVLIVSTAEMATGIFKTNDLSFASRPETPFGDSVLFGNFSFVTAPYGDYWRFMKKCCMTELLGQRQLAQSEIIRREELRRFVRKLLEKARENDAVSVGKEVVELANNSVCRMAMRTRCSEEDNEAERCRTLVEQASERAGKMALAHLLGPLKKLGLWFYRKTIPDFFKSYDEFVEKILKEHEDRASKGEGGEMEDKDLTDILLEVHNDKDAELKISRNHIKSLLSDLIVAGTGTSGESVQWTMAELLNHPNAFSTLRKEIQSIVGKNRLVSESDIPKLYYLQAVVKESMRLHPPVPLIPRACLQDCKIIGFDIPEGTMVAINAFSVMRDPEAWDNPEEFCPERFLVSDNHGLGLVKDEGQKYSNYIPFGGGRRMCPGANLALTMINHAVAAMAQCFDWKIVGGEDGKVDMEAKPGATLSMAHPLICQPVVHFDPFAA